MREQTETTHPPEFYVRINIAKNSKGYQHETTVAMRWLNVTDDSRMDHPSHEYTDRFNFWIPSINSPHEAPSIAGAATTIAGLLRMADEEARDEIERRQMIDAAESGAPS